MCQVTVYFNLGGSPLSLGEPMCGLARLGEWVAGNAENFYGKEWMLGAEWCSNEWEDEGYFRASPQIP